MNWPIRIGILDIYEDPTWEDWSEVYDVVQEFRDRMRFLISGNVDMINAIMRENINEMA